MVPLAGIEPALLAELDFESSASTNSATGACRAQRQGRARSRRNIAGAPRRSTRAGGLAARQRIPVGTNALAVTARLVAARMQRANLLQPRHRRAETLQCDRARLDSAGHAG